MKYTPKLPPRAHQVEALAKGQGREGFGWLMEMGTGKTKTDLDETGHLICGQEISAVLMFAPKGVYKNWQGEEIPKHWPDDLRQEVLFGTWEGGGTRAQREMMEMMCRADGRPRFLSVNLEAMGASDRAVKFVQEYLAAHRRGGVKTSIDESTGIKNPTAVRTRVLDRHVGPQSAIRRILSGQPTPNGPMDMYSQMNWVLPGSLGKSFYSYRARYAVVQKQHFGSRAVDVIVNYRNLDELAQRIEPHTFRKRKDECLDLPPKVYLPIRYVEMTDEQRRVYREVKENATALLSTGPDGDTYVTATMALTQLLRLHQVLCGHVTDEEGRVHLLETKRPSAMLEHCEEVGDSVIIWATYRQDIERIEQALRKAWGDDKVVSYHGGVSGDDREIAKRRFNDGSARFFVSNQTGARGLTLVRSADALYYSNSHDLDTRAQSEDRIHRDGQTRPCTYQDLACENTIEDRLIIPSLRRKMTLASVVMRDPMKMWLI